jgi:acetyl esterase/lipase
MRHCHFGSTAVIANANEEKASEIIMLWPKDAASQHNEGMGTPKPDRGDGHIRLTDVTQPSLRYFPAPGKKKPGPAVILCPGGGYCQSCHNEDDSRLPNGSTSHGISAFILIYRVPKETQRCLSGYSASCPDCPLASIRVEHRPKADWSHGVFSGRTPCGPGQYRF